MTARTWLSSTCSALFVAALLAAGAAQAQWDALPPGSGSSSGGAPSGSAGGDLSGTYPNPTVTQTRGVRETTGPTTLTLAGIADGQILVRSGSTITSRAIDTALPPNGSASGDLGGTYPSPTVTQTRGLRETTGPTTLTMAGVADGQLLLRTGSTITSRAIDTALPPNGSASGDLGGTYPSPTVTQARGLRETAGPTTLTVGAIADGQGLIRSGSTLIGATNNLGDVVGPASSVDLSLPVYSGTTGKLLVAGSGVTNPSAGALTATGLLTSAGLTTSASITASNVATDITTGTNEDLTLTPNGSGVVVLGKQLKLSAIATDITSGTNEDISIVPNGSGSINLQSGTANVVNVLDSGGGNDLTITTSSSAIRGMVCLNQACYESSGNDFIHGGSSANRTSNVGAFSASDSVAAGSSTDLFTIYGEGKVAINVTQAASCAAGVLALDPTSSVVYLNANSAPCVVTIGESNAIVGSDVEVILTANVSGAVTFPNVANVHAGPTACTTTGLSTIGSSYRFHYAGTLNEYVGVACTNN